MSATTRQSEYCNNAHWGATSKIHTVPARSRNSASDNFNTTSSRPGRPSVTSCCEMVGRRYNFRLPTRSFFPQCRCLAQFSQDQRIMSLTSLKLAIDGSSFDLRDIDGCKGKDFKIDLTCRFPLDSLPKRGLRQCSDTHGPHNLQSLAMEKGRR